MTGAGPVSPSTARARAATVWRRSALFGRRWLSPRSADRLFRGLRAALVVVGVVAAVLLVVRWSPFLRVEEVRVEGVTGNRARPIVEAAADLKGQSLLEIDREVVSADLASRPGIAAVAVERDWPSTLVVHVTPRQPVLAVAAAGGVALIDGQGSEVERLPRPPRGIPVATLDGAQASTTSDAPSGDPALVAAATAVQALSPALRSRMEGLTVGGGGAVSFRIGRTAITWGSAEYSAVKSSIVEALLSTPGVRTIDVTTPRTPVTT